MYAYPRKLVYIASVLGLMDNVQFPVLQCAMFATGSGTGVCAVTDLQYGLPYGRRDYYIPVLKFMVRAYGFPYGNIGSYSMGSYGIFCHCYIKYITDTIQYILCSMTVMC